MVETQTQFSDLISYVLYMIISLFAFSIYDVGDSE